MEIRQDKGRGTADNAPNRFEALHFAWDDDVTQLDPNELPSPVTKFYKDHSKSILASNQSPDVGFEHSINPYRGCEHGCVYCYARPTHEYLGMSAGLDFETKIFVKENAPALLRREMGLPSWEPQTVIMSGVTDCYQPIERKLKLTRGCLEVFLDFRNPVALITKNSLVTRDIDILSELAKFQAVTVFLSVTTLDAQLCAKMEPRTSRPEARLKAVEGLAKAGIPVGVNLAPIVPGLTDHEIPNILKAAADHGATSANYVVLRLPYGVKDIFETWIRHHFPDRAEKVLNRIRALRGGNLNVSDFGTRMKGEGVFADQIRSLFKVSARKVGLGFRDESLSTAHFRKLKDNQLPLF